MDQARRGTLPGLVRTGATFADAAAEYLRYAEHDRGCKPSTLRDYRSTIRAHLLPARRQVVGRWNPLRARRPDIADRSRPLAIRGSDAWVVLDASPA